jgi:hypothetical protein
MPLYMAYELHVILRVVYLNYNNPIITVSV